MTVPTMLWPLQFASRWSCQDCLDEDDGTGDTDAQWWVWLPAQAAWVPCCDRHAAEWARYDGLPEYLWTGSAPGPHPPAPLPSLSGLPRQPT